MSLSSLHLRWNIKVNVTRADTHVYFDGISYSFWDESTPPEINPRTYQHQLFSKYCIELYHFAAMKNAHIIGDITGDPQEVEALVESLEHIDEQADWKKPVLDLHVFVDKITNDKVEFGWKFMGYKYELSNLTLGKHEFELFCKRANPVLVFTESWNSYVQAKEELLFKVRRSGLYDEVKTELEVTLNILENVANSYETVCSRLLQLMERYFRLLAQGNNWAQGAGTLHPLVEAFNNNSNPSNELKSLVKIIVSAYRNHLGHGNAITVPAAKILTITCIEIFSSLVDFCDSRGLHN